MMDRTPKCWICTKPLDGEEGTHLQCRLAREEAVRNRAIPPMKELLKQDDIRIWKPSEDLQWVVKICGIGSNPVPVIGYSYVVELMFQHHEIKGYPYTHAIAFECHLHNCVFVEGEGYVLIPD